MSHRRSISKKTKLYKNLLHNNNVFNFSKIKLTHEDLTLLNRGLGFIPTPTKINKTQLIKDINRLERRLQIFYFFGSDPDCEAGETNRDRMSFLKTLGRTSTWSPDYPNPFITTFTTSLYKKMLKIKRNSVPSNLSAGEKLALTKLKNDHSIVIKKCDKGGGIAIMDRSDYIAKINGMLSDTKVYQEVGVDNTVPKKKISDDLIKYAFRPRNQISAKQLNNIVKQKTKTPHFYGLPKVHKPNCPLRPIISQINGPAADINHIVDKYLEVAMRHIPEILQDTTDFLNKIKNITQISDKTILITADITSLYTNIPQKEGAAWVSEFYEETIKHWTAADKSQLPYLPPYRLRDMILHILSSATFTFNGKTYKQLFGTTMGASFSVRYANVYMCQWIRKFREQNRSEVFDNYHRFIDDIFATSNCDMEVVKNYCEELNKFHTSIHFEFEFNYTEAHFLDVTVCKKENSLQTKLYIKPTDRKKYLHFTSAHTKSNKTGIPKSQFIRYRRIISESTEFINKTEELEDRFRERGYPDTLLEKTKNEVSEMDRDTTLKYQTHFDKQAKFEKFLKGQPFLPFITTFFPAFENKKAQFKNIFENQYFNKMGALDPESKAPFESTTFRVFRNITPQLVYSKAKSLENILTRSRLEEVDEDRDIINILVALLEENITQD